MLKTLALTLTLLLSFTMAACSSTSGTNAKIDQTTTNAAQTAPTDAVQRIRLTLANQDELILKLNGTRAAEDFLSLLPLELTCKDFNNTEKVAYLPRRLDIIMKKTNAARILDRLKIDYELNHTGRSCRF